MRRALGQSRGEGAEGCHAPGDQGRLTPDSDGSASTPGRGTRWVLRWCMTTPRLCSSGSIASITTFGSLRARGAVAHARPTPTSAHTSQGSPVADRRLGSGEPRHRSRRTRRPRRRRRTGLPTQPLLARLLASHQIHDATPTAPQLLLNDAREQVPADRTLKLDRLFDHGPDVLMTAKCRITQSKLATVASSSLARASAIVDFPAPVQPRAVSGASLVLTTPLGAAPG